MIIRTDKVEAAVNAIVNDVLPIEATFVSQVALELLINVPDDLLKAVSVVNGIAKARRIHNCQP